MAFHPWGQSALYCSAVVPVSSGASASAESSASEAQPITPSPPNTAVSVTTRFQLHVLIRKPPPAAQAPFVPVCCGGVSAYILRVGRTRRLSRQDRWGQPAR